MIKCCVTSTWHYRGFVFVVVSYNVILRPNCIAILQWFYWLIGYYSYCLITISYRTLLGNNTKNMLHTPAQRMFNEDLWLVAKNHWWHQHRQQSSSQLAPALMFKLLIRIWHREGILAIQQVNICLILFIMINLSHREMWQQMIFVLFVITNVIKKKCNTSSPLIGNQFLLFSARPSRAHSVW